MKKNSFEKRFECRLNPKTTLISIFLTLFMLVSITPNLSAASNSTLQKRISLNLKNVTIKELLNELKKNSEFSFWYSNSDVNDQERVTVVANDKSIEQILDIALQKQKLEFEVKDKLITIYKPKSANSDGPKKSVTVTGRVTDGSTNEPMPGVSVLIKGDMRGTITDIDGKYSIIATQGSTIQYSFIGMKSQTLVLGKNNILNIQLSQDAQLLDEVVVTALNIKRSEKALGYAIQSVSGEGMQAVKGVDMATSLTGKVSGLLVANSTEFAEAPSIKIRGEVPILVIDGVPYGNMTLRDIPSDDIENISVLKGATASALYGSNGQGGAIMVTTKRGLEKNGVSVTFNSSTMFAAGYLAIPELQSSYGRRVNYNPTTSTYTAVQSGDGSWGLPLDGREVIQWDPVSKSMKPMPYLPVGKDNFKNFLEQGFITNNNINLVQQGKYGSFRTSATWVKNKGQYPNSMFDKMTYAIGGDLKINNFSLSSNMSYNKQTSPNVGFSGYTGYDPMYNLLIWSAPDYDIRQYTDYWTIKNEIQNSSYTDTNNNPYFDRYERIHSVDKDILNGTLTLNYEFLPWLKSTIRSGFDTYSNQQQIRISKGSFKSAGVATITPNGSQVWGESDLGQYNLGLSRGYSLSNDLILSAEKKFEKFSVSGFVGGSINYRQDEGIEAFTQGGITIPGFYSLKASVNPAVVHSNISKKQVNSLYGQLALSWKSMLFAEGTLRNDWSSTLPASTRSYLYPSVAGSFVVSELMPKYDWLSLWKFRGSWTNSKTPAGIYEINSDYSISNSAWGSLSAASLPTSIRGTDVRPLSSSTIEFGSAINILKSRASLDIAYYAKKDYDFLRYAGISPASGYYSKFVNIDEEITRKGIEITLNGTPIKTKDWQWDVSCNWSTYARYYTKLDPVFSADKPWVKVGERADAYILRDFQREPASGKIIYDNGLPKYSDYDSKFGYYDPNWIWGANTSLRYKNLTFNMSFDGRVGGLTATTTEMYMWRAGSHPGSVTQARFLDATNPGTKNYVGDGVKVVSGAATYDTYGNILTDTRVFAANDVAETYEAFQNTYHKNSAWGGPPSPVDAYSTTFFKIREISLMYAFPKQLCSKVHAANISLSAIGQNMMLWAKQFKYSDPDGGYENFSDPSIRYIGFNLKVGF
ncbi:MAG: SusC/RagA family TonB-linked outer membrane protein [Bacteroidales bacterium]|nr:SusC/RagA family TonB-linked outer membrane protein [Bacteroidales bacterium]